MNDKLITLVLHCPEGDKIIKVLQCWNNPAQTNWLMIDGKPRATFNPIDDIMDILNNYYEEQKGRESESRTEETKQIEKMIKQSNDNSDCKN
jgi:hypothetical protein